MQRAETSEVKNTNCGSVHIILDGCEGHDVERTAVRNIGGKGIPHGPARSGRVRSCICDEGQLYLAAILESVTRKVVGWSKSKTMTAYLPGKPWRSLVTYEETLSSRLQQTISLASSKALIKKIVKSTPGWIRTTDLRIRSLVSECRSNVIQTANTTFHGGGSIKAGRFLPERLRRTNISPLKNDSLGTDLQFPASDGRNNEEKSPRVRHGARACCYSCYNGENCEPGSVPVST